METPQWRKSSHSGAQGGNCVEVARLPRGIALRDSKHPEGGHTTVTPAQFASLLHTIKQH